MKSIFNQEKNLRIAYILMGLCFFTLSQAQRIDIAGIPFQPGINITNPGTDGIHIQSAGDDGIEVRDSKYGIYIVNSTERGVWVNGAVKSGGYFVNDATSTDPALYADQGHGDYPDLFLGGYRGIIAANENVEIILDHDNNSIGDHNFSVNGPGFTAMYVTEKGNASFAGNVSKGGGSFKIDHPIDPENKYLYHSFVESPDMMNIYNGNIILDEKGEATIAMADWFEVLNRDFRYQLTPIGAPGPNLYVAQEMTERTFRIAGGTPGMKVSWQVTGIRHDPFANENRIEVEVTKEDFNKGKYIHPREWEKARGVTGLQAVTLTERQAARQHGAANEIIITEEQPKVHKKVEKSNDVVEMEKKENEKMQK